MARLQRYLFLICGVAGSLQAAGLPSVEAFGVQAALVFPASPDLRTTAGSLGYGFGVHGTWVLEGRHSVRPRLDLTWLPSASQASSGAGVLAGHDHQGEQPRPGGRLPLPLE